MARTHLRGYIAVPILSYGRLEFVCRRVAVRLPSNVWPGFIHDASRPTSVRHAGKIVQAMRMPRRIAVLDRVYRASEWCRKNAHAEDGWISPARLPPPQGRAVPRVLRSKGCLVDCQAQLLNVKKAISHADIPGPTTGPSGATCLPICSKPHGQRRHLVIDGWSHDGKCYREMRKC